MLKIRLQRFGRKKLAYYHIVAADSRSPRDGKSIENLGNYNPNTNPATINLNLERAVYWLDNGAQPSDTARAILSYKGAMMKHHLNGGVRKGALTAEQAEEKFNTWMAEKDAKVLAKREKLAGSADMKKKERHAAESKIRQDRAAALEAKRNAANAEPVAETAEEEIVVAETPVSESTSEETVANETTAEPTADAAPADETKGE